MQVAASPYPSSLPHSHYHSYYQLHPPGPQDHDLKRRYLALLPPQQIIEICLTFDLHVPPYIKSTIWPPDINAAIAGLQKTTPQAPTEQPPEEPAKAKDSEPAVMDSLKSPAPKEPSSSAQDGAPPTEPQPPDKETSTPTSDPSTSSSADQPPKESPAPSTPKTASDPPSTAPEPAQPSSTTPAPAAPTPAPPLPPPQPQYPHQPYSYAHHHQATYPISPYYAQPPGGYSYPYAPYANPMQSAYHPQPPPAYPTQPSMYNSMLPIPHPIQQQQQQDGMAGDDLPSYEEMIVEALTGCGDPEGWAPKDLFSWMASRYPLQSNFRPSASQALQKAYKRGRFGKSANGKYSLNPAWEGGNTTRRTTRRPQTQSSQTAPGSAASVPPFTHAPLVHHHHGHGSTSSQPPQPYPPQPFGYSPYSHANYPGYPPQPNPSPTTPAAASAGPSTAVDKPSAPSATPTSNTEGDSVDAYEAAQNILSAINFTNMYQIPPEDTKDGQVRDLQPSNDVVEPLSDNGVEQLLSHVKAMLASSAASQPTAPTIPQPMSADASADPRAELQAQFALLAAQLAELAQLEDTASVTGQNVNPAPPNPPVQIHPPPTLPPTAPSTVIPTEHVQAQIPIPNTASPQIHNATDDDIPEPMPEGDDSEDDDDMEEII